MKTEAWNTCIHSRLLLFILIFISLSGVHTFVFAQDSGDQNPARGPVATRKHFPTDLLFLGFPMQKAAGAEAGTFSWSLNYTQSNSFVKSGSILEALPAEDNRIVFSRELADELIARNPLGDAYFFDLEVQRVALSVRYSLAPKVSFGFEASFLRFGGGFMDGVIESFHSTFGIPDDERPDFKKNTAQAFVYLSGNFWYRSREDLTGAGIGDVILTAQYLLKSEGKRSPLLAAELGLKLPTVSWRKSRGSGSADFGLRLLATKNIARNAFYLSIDGVFPGKWQALPDFSPATFFVLQMAYERLIGKNFSLLLQANSNSNPFFGKTATGLNNYSHELTLGVKFNILRTIRCAAAISENYAYFRNSPDLGFQLGLEMR
ncbi:MAG: DUF3187 family protein [bacterium]